MNKSKHGGKRAGAGRKPASRDPKKKLRAVWAWTTPEEQQMINTVLTADERTLILFRCVVAKQNGDDWWSRAPEQLSRKAKGEDIQLAAALRNAARLREASEKE